MTGYQDYADTVLLERPEPHVAIVRLNRPDKANTIASPWMNRVLADRLREAEADDEIKVIVLSSTGRHFCAGEDVGHTPMDSGPAADKKRRKPQSQRLSTIAEIEDIWTRHLLMSAKTTIAAVQGGAIGLGFRLALYCDLVVASEDAYFSRPQSRIGLAGLDMGLPVLLLKCGINRGYELLVTGRRASAAELKDWGVVSSVVPTAQLTDESMRYARAVAAHSTDGLMVGREAMRMFWNLTGIGQWRSFGNVAHALFTNLVWREDEVNLFKERESAASPREALKRVYQRWEELGFE